MPLIMAQTLFICLFIIIIIIICCCKESDSLNHYFYKNNLISVTHVVTMFTDIKIYIKYNLPSFVSVNALN